MSSSIMLEQYAAAKQKQQEAYECCSNRVLLQGRWVLLLLLLLLLLLSARVPVTAWPRRARVCIVLVELEKSNDRGPGSFYMRRNWLDTYYSCSLSRVLLESSTPQYKNSNIRRTRAARIECCLSAAECCCCCCCYCCFLLLLLSAPVLVTAWPQLHDNTLFPQRTWGCFFNFLGAIHHLFIGSMQ